MCDTFTRFVCVCMCHTFRRGNGFENSEIGVSLAYSTLAYTRGYTPLDAMLDGCVAQGWPLLHIHTGRQPYLCVCVCVCERERERERERDVYVYYTHRPAVGNPGISAPHGVAACCGRGGRSSNPSSDSPLAKSSRYIRSCAPG